MKALSVRPVNPLRLLSTGHSSPQYLPHPHYPILTLHPVTGSAIIDTTTAYLLSPSPIKFLIRVALLHANYSSLTTAGASMP